jgi:uncharacterized Zn-binding protein involved in type VI secretion
MPAAARKGDQGIPHCSGYTIAAGSGDVFINSIAAARQGDNSTPHLKPGPGKPPCSTHSASISRGSSTVFVNGKPLARVGDPLAGCTSVGQGSPNVFAG